MLGPVIQAAHLPLDGLFMPRMEVCCLHPCPRAAGLQSKCLRLASGAPWHVSSRQIHEDLAVPLFADIRALTASFDSKLADVGNVHPFSHICNIGHVNCRLQLTTHLVIVYRHPHNTK
jgi:hypothetical protein